MHLRLTGRCNHLIASCGVLKSGIIVIYVIRFFYSVVSVLARRAGCECRQGVETMKTG